MFNSDIRYSLRDLLSKYGGQDSHGIITPAKYPYIFLIHNNEKYKDDLFAAEDGSSSVVNYRFEPNSDLSRYGNKAIIEHATRKGIYHSIFLFTKTDDNYLKYVGEYEYKDHTKGNKGADEKAQYFILEAVKDNIDEDDIYIVDEVFEEDDFIVVSELGTRLDRHDEKIEPMRKAIKIDKKVSEGSFIRENGTGYDILLSSEVPIPKDFSLDKKNRKISHHIWILTVQNGYIAKMNKQPVTEPKNPHNVFSYHINTGCGTTAFVVFNDDNGPNLWCFDCGIEGNCAQENDDDKLKIDLQIYRENIKRCLEHIDKKFYKGSPITLSKLFLSHPHDDHYNFILSDLDLDIDELWINPYILTSGTKYIKLLNKLENKVNSVHEPVAKNSFKGVNILWPDKRIIYGHKIRGRVNLALSKKNAYLMGSNYNNLSPVISIELNNKTMLVTGDIEKSSWNKFKKSTNSGCFHRKTDIYCHSHHGSKTGIEINCPYGPKNNILNCIEAKNHAVLTTRSGAYEGIVAPEVSKSNNLLRTDEYIISKPMSFIEIEWDTMKQKKIAKMKCKNYGKRNRTVKL